MQPVKAVLSYCKAPVYIQGMGSPVIGLRLEIKSKSTIKIKKGPAKSTKNQILHCNPFPA